MGGTQIVATGADNPLSSLWLQLSNSAWVANVGIPLGVTLAALAFTFVSLTTQLRHDRQLAAEETKRAAAARLATRFRSAAREMDLFFTLESTADTPDDEFHRWMAGQFSIRYELERAITATHVVIGESGTLEEMRKFVDSIGPRWKAAALCGQRHLLTHPINRLHVALRMATGTDSVILVDFAFALETWSGKGDIPSVTEQIAKQKTPPAPDIGAAMPDGSPGPGKTASDEWHEARLAEFRAALDTRAYHYPAGSYGPLPF